ncbi:MAG: DNA polymerase IV [Gemmatimonadales bacterium]
MQVDADAFFVQVARLLDPEGAGQAEFLLVGGSPTGRGVVTSASYGCRQFGVTSGMPTARALRLCPDTMVVGVSRKEVSRRSKAIVEVLHTFTPAVEPASVDEMYLDLSGTEGLYRESFEATARRLRAAIKDATQIMVSVGGATSRFVAKLAAGRAKPHKSPDADGVLIIPPGGEAAFLATLQLADLPGVGPKFEERLAHYGMTRVQDALRHDERTLTGWFGEHAGRWLWHRIRGHDASMVRHHEVARSLSRDETFFKDLDTERDLLRQLQRLSDRAAHDLRQAGWTARTVSVRIRDRDFKDRRKSRTLPHPIVTDQAIYDVARDLFHALRLARPTPARLLSVSLSQLQDQGEADQTTLFPEAGHGDDPKALALSKAVDRARQKFGRDAVERGGTL